RFCSISLDKVIQYNELLPKKLRHDILNYHTNKNYKPKTPLLPPRTVQASKYDIDSLIINGKQVEWISSKIVEAASQHQENNNQRKKSIKQDGAYKFTLLYRQSRDGNKVANFRKLCNGKGPTITVGKVLDTDEILGGYN